VNAFDKFERVLRFGICTAGSALFTPSIDDLGCCVLLNRRTNAVARGCATRLGSRWRCARFKLLQLGFVYAQSSFFASEKREASWYGCCSVKPWSLGIIFDLGASVEQILVVEITIRADLGAARRRN